MTLTHLIKPEELNGPILVTGHTGFKGMWLTLLLRHLGYRVIGLSLPPENNSLYERLNYQGTIEESFQNVCDTSRLNEFFSFYKPSIVFHLAGQALVLESYADPLGTFQTNVQGTANILEVSAKVGSVLKVSVTTTDKVYLNENYGKSFTENDPLRGSDPYSCSKVATESAILAFQNISKVRGGPSISSLRAGNVIGGGDLSKDRIVPDIVRALSNGLVPEIRNPLSTRPWQHVLDPLAGYLLATLTASELSSSENYNFGPDGKSLSVEKLYSLSTNAWNNGKDPEPYLRQSATYYESITLSLNSEKARANLGWCPKYSQENAIRSTIEWWKVIFDGADPLETCNREISKFLANSTKLT